jgi:hypothetical protein
VLKKKRFLASFRLPPGGESGGRAAQRRAGNVGFGSGIERLCGQHLPPAAFFGSFLVRVQEMNIFRFSEEKVNAGCNDAETQMTGFGTARK